MSEAQKIGVYIDWHIPSRSTTGPGFAPVDHWAQRLHEVCDSAIEAALKTGSAHIEIKVLNQEAFLVRSFLKTEKLLAPAPETGPQTDNSGTETGLSAKGEEA